MAFIDASTEAIGSDSYFAELDEDEKGVFDGIIWFVDSRTFGIFVLTSN